jgi:hypothetical protein
LGIPYWVSCRTNDIDAAEAATSSSMLDVCCDGGDVATTTISAVANVLPSRLPPYQKYRSRYPTSPTKHSYAHASIVIPRGNEDDLSLENDSDDDEGDSARDEGIERKGEEWDERKETSQWAQWKHWIAPQTPSFPSSLSVTWHTLLRDTYFPPVLQKKSSNKTQSAREKNDVKSGDEHDSKPPSSPLFSSLMSLASSKASPSTSSISLVAPPLSTPIEISAATMAAAYDRVAAPRERSDVQEIVENWKAKQQEVEVENKEEEFTICFCDGASSSVQSRFCQSCAGGAATSSTTFSVIRQTLDKNHEREENFEDDRVWRSWEADARARELLWRLVSDSSRAEESVYSLCLGR